MTIDRYSEAIESVADILEVSVNKNYGAPYSNHVDIAQIWSVLLGKDIGPGQVAMCMVAVKLSRLIHEPTHDDSWADIIGYGGIGRGIADIEKMWLMRSKKPNVLDMTVKEFKVELRCIRNKALQIYANRPVQSNRSYLNQKRGKPIGKYK